MAQVLTIHIHEGYGRVVDESGPTELVRLDHSPGLSKETFEALAKYAWDMTDYDAGDVIQLHIMEGTVFKGEGSHE